MFKRATSVDTISLHSAIHFYWFMVDILPIFFVSHGERHQFLYIIHHSLQSPSTSRSVFASAGLKYVEALGRIIII